MVAQAGILTIDPRFMTARGWSAQTSINLWRFGPIPTLKDDDEWRAWAQYVVSLPGIAGFGVPWPQQFRAWQDWAVQFNLAIALITV